MWNPVLRSDRVSVATGAMMPEATHLQKPLGMVAAPELVSIRLGSLARVALYKIPPLLHSQI